MKLAELTEDQRRPVERGEPVRITDVESRQSDVLVRADVYDRAAAKRDEFDPRRADLAVDEAWRDGWNDPQMADYDRYEDHRP